MGVIAMQRELLLPAQDAKRTTPLFNPLTDSATAEWDSWFEAGKHWCGGHYCRNEGEAWLS